MNLSRHVLDYEVIVLQFTKPPGYSPVDFSCGLPVCQVSIVCEDGNGDFHSCNVGSEASQCFQNSQKLSLIYVIVPFCQCECV